MSFKPQSSKHTTALSRKPGTNSPKRKSLLLAEAESLNNRFVALGVVFFEVVEQAAALANELGEARAILMRGNGTVTAGATLQEAVVLTYFLEDACRIELACLATGLADEATIMTDEEAATRATWNGRILERMWDYLTQI